MTKGEATVWILGYVEPMPKGLQWNTARLSRIMDHATRVILPARASVGVFQALGAVNRSHLPKGETLDGDLPASLRQEYHDALSKLGRDPARYQNEKPGWAALMLELDLEHARNFTTDEPTDTVRRLARERHVPVVQAGAYNGGPMLIDLVGLSEQDGEAALADAIHGVDFALDHTEAAANAWASGDLGRVRENLTPDATPKAPLRRTPTYQVLEARSVDDIVTAVNQALAQPGVSVALSNLTSLARRGGALDRLRAEGVSVTEPAD